MMKTFKGIRMIGRQTAETISGAVGPYNQLLIMLIMLMLIMMNTL